MSVAEMKIVFIFLSFLILGIFILCLNRYLKSREDEFFSALTQYFTCEAFGHVEGKCDRNTFTKVYNPVMFSVLYIFMGLIPLSILNFVLKWNSVKTAGVTMRKFVGKRLFRFQESSDKTTSDDHSSDQTHSSP